MKVAIFGRILKTEHEKDFIYSIRYNIMLL